MASESQSTMGSMPSGKHREGSKDRDEIILLTDIVTDSEEEGEQFIDLSDVTDWEEIRASADEALFSKELDELLDAEPSSGARGSHNNSVQPVEVLGIDLDDESKLLETPQQESLDTSADIPPDTFEAVWPPPSEFEKTVTEDPGGPEFTASQLDAAVARVLIRVWGPNIDALLEAAVSRLVEAEMKAVKQFLKQRYTLE